MLLHELYIHTAVKGGVPKLGNCLKMYMWWPNCAHHVYKLKHSLYTGATAWPFLVHWSCIHAWELAWAHVYTSKQFPSLGTPTLTAVTAMSPVPDVCKFEVQIQHGQLAIVFGEMNELSHTAVGVKTDDIRHLNMRKY